MKDIDLHLAFGPRRLLELARPLRRTELEYTTGGRVNEKVLAMLTVAATSASMVFLVPGLYYLILFGPPAVAWWWFARAAASIGALYALATLSGKRRQRRLASWGFSTVFHGAMVWFLLASHGNGPYESRRIAFLALEVTAFILSLGGLRLAVSEDAS